MPEPTPNPFENFQPDPGTPMNPLPAAEVRRRGDRLRRRNSVMAVAGAAAAVVLIATPLALLSNDDERSAPPIANTPSPTATEATEREFVTTIPGDFDLTIGIEAGESSDPVEQSETSEGVGSLDFCGRSSLDRTPITDRLGVRGGGAEAAHFRELVLYPDDTAAQAAIDGVREQVAACPEEPFDGTTWFNNVTDSAFAGGSTLVARQIVAQDAVRAEEFWQFVRVGNAVLINQRGGESITVSRVDDESPSLNQVVEQLCVFSAEGCPDVDTSPAPTPEDPGPATPQLGDIPEDFPLTAGWPTDFEPGANNGITGPNSGAEPFAPDFCNGPLPDPAAQGRLAAIFRNVEDYRSRELYSFADAGDAVAYMDSLRAAADCGTADLQGTQYAFDVRPSAVGGQSFALVRLQQFEGRTERFDVVNAVRLGRAVVLDYLSNDAVGPTNVEAAITQRVELQEDLVAPVIAAMCRFTEAGC